MSKAKSADDLDYESFYLENRDAGEYLEDNPDEWDDWD